MQFSDIFNNYDISNNDDIRWAFKNVTKWDTDAEEGFMNNLKNESIIFTTKLVSK